MKSRLAPVAGEWIDRTHTVEFHFDAKPFSGFAGDTISSALLANGVAVLGRSFKYHRPRGVMSMANHDANVMLQQGARLNVRGDVEALENAAAYTVVNTSGSVNRDTGRIFDWLSPLLPVGFYYKAFHTPRFLGAFWERVFRRLTGLGRLDSATPRIRTPKRYDNCDVLVVGAGLAGMAAAIAAAEAGASVVLVDENARIGGSLGYQRAGGDQALEQLEQMRARIEALPGIDVRCATFAAGYYADNWVPLVDAIRITKMRARALIVASGVYEQPAVFRNNDLPGVMLASAAQRLMYRYAVRPMRRAVVLTANADGYVAALDLLANGVEVAAVVDLTDTPDSGPEAAELAQREVRVLQAHTVLEAHGKHSVEAVTVCALARGGVTDTARSETVACDGLVVSVGYAPAAPLLYQAGAQMKYDQALEQFVPETLPAGVLAAGRVNGVYSQRQEDGHRAGVDAARQLGFDVSRVPSVERDAGGINHPYPVFAHPKAKNFVDFDEDLQLKDLENAAQEGFDSIELLKRYSTIGMGPSQGKHSNMNAIRILARIMRSTPGEVGSTTARPLYHPVPMSHLGGRGFNPQRVTPLHDSHVENSAVFMHAGHWLRPEYYARSGRSRSELVREEAMAVRRGVGLIDVGTLGKIEVHGPDAAELLERVYCGRFARLKAGMTRYALMVDEAGVIIDDGVIARLSEQHFYFTTTTTGSSSVYQELTRLNTMWRLRVGIVNVTGHTAAMNLAGPLSRQVLQPLTDIDLSAQAFPYLGVREGKLAGVEARVLRVGFVGELGYEIHVAADSALHVWNAIMEAGEGRDLRLFGVEAQRLLRLEKGHVIIGQDTDGLCNPLEAGMSWALKMDKSFFVGQRSLQILQNRPLQRQLTGFTLDGNAGDAAPAECNLVIRNGEIAGRVTSIAFSPALGKFIGLAFLRPELSAAKTRFFIRVSNGRMFEAVSTTLPFYDPLGERQRTDLQDLAEATA
ncbi:MAG: glycine cleavage T C-terminal barrel domain-containing protein [Burkholderiales bacterium]|jgi:sarcosine oxidase subunit alpha